MFVKVFDQILDSSIAENYELRHFFEDLLKLADVTGAVDMTPEAVGRRINLPIEKVLLFFGELGKPDLKSRSSSQEGRRIVALDSHRDWGWLIVNYTHYRAIRNQEARREYNRDAQAKYRDRKNGRKKNVGDDGRPASEGYKGRERAAVRALVNGDSERFDDIAASK